MVKYHYHHDAEPHGTCYPCKVPHDIYTNRPHFHYEGELMPEEPIITGDQIIKASEQVYGNAYQKGYDAGVKEQQLRTEIKPAYIDIDWSRCPGCGSPEIEGNAIEIQDSEAWQECSCNNCDGTWNEVYRAGYRMDVECM